MMPLGVARLWAAGGAAVLAGVAGLALSTHSAPTSRLTAAGGIGGPEPVNPDDISALSARLRATGLFPAAIPLEDTLASDPTSVASHLTTLPGGEAAVAIAPPIVALVREDGVWRIHAGGVITERARLNVGDELYDGWRIEEIGATQVLLRRGDEVFPIDVFDPQGEG